MKIDFTNSTQGLLGGFVTLQGTAYPFLVEREPGKPDAVAWETGSIHPPNTQDVEAAILAEIHNMEQ